MAELFREFFPECVLISDESTIESVSIQLWKETLEGYRERVPFAGEGLQREDSREYLLKSSNEIFRICNDPEVYMEVFGVGECDSVYKCKIATLVIMVLSRIGYLNVHEESQILSSDEVSNLEKTVYEILGSPLTRICELLDIPEDYLS